MKLGYIGPVTFADTSLDRLRATCTADFNALPMPTQVYVPGVLGVPMHVLQCFAKMTAAAAMRLTVVFPDTLETSPVFVQRWVPLQTYDFVELHHPLVAADGFAANNYMYDWLVDQLKDTGELHIFRDPRRPWSTWLAHAVRRCQQVDCCYQTIAIEEE